MSPGFIVVRKKLRTIASCIIVLQLDNTFNSFNFAFSLGTIITYIFDLGTFLKYAQIEGRTVNSRMWGV